MRGALYFYPYHHTESKFQELRMPRRKRNEFYRIRDDLNKLYFKELNYLEYPTLCREISAPKFATLGGIKNIARHMYRNLIKSKFYIESQFLWNVPNYRELQMEIEFKTQEYVNLFPAPEYSHLYIPEQFVVEHTTFPEFKLRDAYRLFPNVNSIVQ
jgi:hypothetical protein